MCRNRKQTTRWALGNEGLKFRKLRPHRSNSNRLGTRTCSSDSRFARTKQPTVLGTLLSRFSYYGHMRTRPLLVHETHHTTFAFIAFLWLMCTAPTRAQTQPSQSPARALSSQEWREDLHYMAANMAVKHKSLFHTMSQAEFERAVAKLDTDIPSLNADQIVVRLAQLGAMVQDGHSGLDLVFSRADSRIFIPVRFAQYADGIYIRAAAPEYADAVGGRVVNVGPLGWKEAIERINSVVPHDPGNDGEFLAWGAKSYLSYPMVLHGLDLSTSNESAQFVIEKSGYRRTYRMKASAPLGQPWLDSLPEGWVDARPKAVPTPLSQQHTNEPYWMTPMADSHVLYFQFNIVQNAKGETLSDFSQRLSSFIDQHEVERVVIDLRNNTGGDNTLLRPLLLALIRSKVNRRGGLYAIIGPTTFSAAQNFVNRLENYTETIFVGSPTSNNVNFYGDPDTIELPHSHMEVAVSHLWWQDKDPRDDRTATAPEVAASTTFQDYVAGDDPVLQLALTMPTPPTIEESLEAILPKGVDATLMRYTSYVNDPAHKYLPDPERRVNNLGYRLISAKRIPDAITVLEVNARVHPNSWNAFDSLGEAYADAGDKQNALKAYRRSLELNPANTNGKHMIERIEAP